MRIVVLGAGTVGTSIASLLCHHRHIITVVDDDPAHVRQIDERLDVRAVRGSASQSSVLFQADILGADLCLAVTGDDEGEYRVKSTRTNRLRCDVLWTRITPITLTDGN